MRDSRGWYAGEGCVPQESGDFGGMGKALPRNRGSAQEESRGCLSVSVAGAGPSLRSGKGHAVFPKVPDAALPFSPNPKRLIMKRIAALIMGFVLMVLLVEKMVEL